MHERDYEPFSSMLDDVWGMYPQAKAPSPAQKAMFFRALAEHTIAAVRKGFDGHVRDSQRGRFAPLPADIVAQIEGASRTDGRPGPEEGWAIALNAADENKTLVWTGEIAQAWGICKGVFDTGDQVGARMTFKEAYTRLVADARSHGKPAVWTASLGLDAQGRDEELNRAHLAGLLPASERLRELPAPDHAMSTSNGSMPGFVRVQLQAMREAIAARQTQDETSTPIGSFKPVAAEACPWNRSEA